VTANPDRKPLRARLAAAVAYPLTRYAHHLGVHAYLSTGCLHGDHGYCQGMTGLAGKKRPGECKHCGAKCVCECHAPPERRFSDGVRQLGEQLDRQKEQQ
jgi:hypothetical protein